MSAPLDQKSFHSANVAPVSRSAQAQMELGLRLMLSGMLPPKIRGFRAADGVDIANRIDHFETVYNVYVDYLTALFEELNCNLPLDNTVPTADFFDGLSDLRSDITCMMQRAADRINEGE